ncbi:TIGR03086 family metal-binding protein [Amycolatopsis carbonis]|uniref:TIGR03086 family metal-binding protein n=1 Tax=Amycolatopsis carbonis TaxID=715471 RepID=A0A9Y2IJM9_9PSEU|nr:TIGR03086 family metal-binding protein [Amycolatopsis sp. 2-15]WIX81337.1 TIGR03086 family metal-binding protein [Amycolatopsis sp. 2-15]
MTDHSALLRPAAAEFLRVAAAAQPLTAPTPCTGYDVRGLLNHLLYWGPWLAAAGRRETYTATGTEADAVLVGEDWLATLEKQTEDLVDAFAPAAAWEGLATLGSATMPAATVGDMVLGEFVIHGWDLARAAGTPLTCSEEATAAAEAVRASAVAMGEQARAMGVYGPEVPVPAGAPALDRALGASGRDPAWTV